jgi:putative ABC transport system permease protein
MNLGTIVRANLWRRKRRTILTVAGIAIAFFLLVTLRSIVGMFAAAGRVGPETRLVVRNRTGIVFPLPRSYRSRLLAIDGVTDITWSNWFGGVYIETRNFFPQFAVDAESFLRVHPEFVLPEDQKQAFLKERIAVVAARSLADRFGWHLGQTIPLRGTLFPGEHRFILRGIYDPSEPGFDRQFLLHWDYLKERYRASDYLNNVGWYIISVREPSAAPRVAAEIDSMYVNSADPTRSETEHSFQLGMLSMYGNIALYLNLVGAAVVFAILLVAANTMAMSVRERAPEIAVLKTLGFRTPVIVGLVVAESAVMAGLGYVLGTSAAWLLFGRAAAIFGGLFPMLTLTPRLLALAALVAALLGLVSGAAPAWRAARLQVVDALRRTA